MSRTLITAGAIHAGDPPRPGPTAMVVEGSRITWLGPVAEVPRPTPKRKVELGEASVVIPGLIDCHLHMIDLPLLARWVDCRWARTRDEALARMRSGAVEVPHGEWVVGWGYDAAGVENGRRATRSQLDEAVPGRPALLAESSFHQGAANSPALAAVGWGRATPRWFGGELERDRRGEPTGMAWEAAFSVLWKRARGASEEALASQGALAERYRLAARDLLAQGITHAGEALAGPEHLELLREASLDVGFTVMPGSGRHWFAPPWDALAGPVTGQGDPHLAVGPLKLFADGAERCAMSIPLPAALRQTAGVVRNARRDPTGVRVLLTARARLSGGRFRSGTLHHPPGRLADLIEAALRRGFRTAVHALGNEGFRQAVSAYEEARRRTGVAVAGCRIEHGHFAEGPDIERAAALGLILSMQPGHAVHYARTMRSAQVDRIFDPVPVKAAVEAGCRVAISSDGPTAPGTALDNMRGAVDRIAADGEPIRPDLAIGRIDALRAATLGGAEACDVAGVKGSLAPRKQADFAVLSGDPFDPTTRVEQTWVAGRRVWPSR